MIKVYPARKNLGCFGVGVGEKFYADMFRKPFLGLYVRVGQRRWTLSLSGLYRWR